MRAPPRLGDGQPWRFVGVSRAKTLAKPSIKKRPNRLIRAARWQRLTGHPRAGRRVSRSRVCAL
jgi:hypothetical protein